MNGNKIPLLTTTYSVDHMLIYLMDYDLHCYIQLLALELSQPQFKRIVKIVPFTAKADECSWSEIKAKIEKAHSHVCVYASLRDMQALLERNGLLLNDDKAYLYQSIDTCPNIHLPLAYFRAVNHRRLNSRPCWNHSEYTVIPQECVQITSVE